MAYKEISKSKSNFIKEKIKRNTGDPGIPYGYGSNVIEKVLKSSNFEDFLKEIDAFISNDYQTNLIFCVVEEVNGPFDVHLHEDKFFDHIEIYKEQNRLKISVEKNILDEISFKNFNIFDEHYILIDSDLKKIGQFFSEYLKISSDSKPYEMLIWKYEDRGPVSSSGCMVIFLLLSSSFFTMLFLILK